MFILIDDFYEGSLIAFSILFFREMWNVWQLDEVVSPRQVAAIDFIGHPLCASWLPGNFSRVSSWQRQILISSRRQFPLPPPSLSLSRRVQPASRNQLLWMWAGKRATPIFDLSHYRREPFHSRKMHSANLRIPVSNGRVLASSIETQAKPPSINFLSPAAFPRQRPPSATRRG